MWKRLFSYQFWPIYIFLPFVKTYRFSHFILQIYVESNGNAKKINKKIIGQMTKITIKRSIFLLAKHANVQTHTHKHTFVPVVGRNIVILFVDNITAKSIFVLHLRPSQISSWQMTTTRKRWQRFFSPQSTGSNNPLQIST